MTHTAFLRADLPAEHLAKGYQSDPQRVIPYAEGFYRYAAGLWSSPRDLAVFMRALLDGGAPITTPEALAIMERPKSTLAARHGLSIGHGPGAVMRQSAGRVLAGHAGIIDGFVATFYYSRELGMGYVILFNAHILGPTPSRARIEAAISKEFFSDKQQEAAAAVEVPEEELRRWEGFYRYVNPRFALIGFVDRLTMNAWIDVEASGLRLRTITGAEESLVPIGGNKFRRRHEVAARYIFGLNDDGRRFLYETANDYFVEESPLTVLATVIMLAATLTMMALYPVIFVLKLVLPALRRRPLLPWIAPMLPILILVSLPLFLVPIDGAPKATSFNALTAGIFGVTALFPVAALVALGIVLWRGRAFKVQLVPLLTAVSTCVVAAYLAWNGIFGVRFWAMG